MGDYRICYTKCLQWIGSNFFFQILFLHTRDSFGGRSHCFSLEISDANNVGSIQLLYKIDDGSYETLAMTTSDNLNYSATVPALAADGELYYYFKLTDDGGSEVLLPDDALTDPYDITLTSGDVPNLVINEIMASNTTTLADPDGVDEYDDWLEIYNAGSTTVDMDRFYFSDSENPFDDRIPAMPLIKPRFSLADT
jgi:hypothetical protein